MSMLKEDTNELMDTIFKVDFNLIMDETNDSHYLSDYLSTNFSLDYKDDEVDISWIDSDYIDLFMYEEDKRFKNKVTHPKIVKKDNIENYNSVANKKEDENLNTQNKTIENKQNSIIKLECINSSQKLKKYSQNRINSNGGGVKETSNILFDKKYYNATLPEKRKFHIRSITLNNKKKQIMSKAIFADKIIKHFDIPKIMNSIALHHYDSMNLGWGGSVSDLFTSHPLCSTKNDCKTLFKNLSHVMDDGINVLIYNLNNGF
uniref:Autophagy-related protein 7 n=2 Tax=Strongyloides stercoralis TaxID=6248 RepID=A0A0K0ES16_STRER